MTMELTDAYENAGWDKTGLAQAAAPTRAPTYQHTQRLRFRGWAMPGKGLAPLSRVRSRSGSGPHGGIWRTPLLAYKHESQGWVLLRPGRTAPLVGRSVGWFQGQTGPGQAKLQNTGMHRNLNRVQAMPS